MSATETTPLERARDAHDSAVARMHELADAADAAEGEERDAAHAAFEEAREAVEDTKREVERRQAIDAAKAAHPAPTPVAAADPALHARARGAAMEELVYRADKGTFIQDVLRSGKSHDPAARERMARHNDQMIDTMRNDPELHLRAGDLTSATHGGEFIVPLWTNDLYGAKLRPGRPFADQCRDAGPVTSNSWNLPRITTGASTAAQTEGSAVSNTDIVTDSINAALVTLGGYQLVSNQLLDFAEPGMDQILLQDLRRSLNATIDSNCLNSTTTGNKGVIALSGVNAITFNATTPTPALFWPSIFQANVAIAKGIYQEGADFVCMHPSTWFWLLAGLDTQNRPFFTSTGVPQVNALGNSNGVVEGLAGNIDGLPVILDHSIPVTGGAGTNQATVVLCNRSELLKKESPPTVKVADQPGATTLTTQIVMSCYLQTMFGRHPLAFSVVTGTGLVVQSGY